MSLSTLLEAAKYLDYLDSNKHGQQQPPPQLQPQQTQPTNAKKSTRRQRSSRKDAANTMVAMSLPASTGPIQMQHGVPIPLASNHGDHHHQAASLSSSFTTGSPISSFASTALLCSKASGVTSASSSTASSLSSSDSSSSCGEILMGDNDFNQPSTMASFNAKAGNSHHHSHNLTHQQQLKHTFDHPPTNQPTLMHKFSSSNNDSSQSFARYIAATSSGPQLVTMNTSSAGLTSASAPIEGRIRAGHVIQAGTNNAGTMLSATGTSFDSRHFSIATANGLQHDGQTFGLATTTTGSLGSDNHLSSSPGSCPPLIMARVQPMILNSISPSAHQSIMAFQPAAASSPTSSSSSYSRHRELHKTLEKNRRAHLRHCFELLKAELPASECVDKKTSHINIIKSAIRYVLALRQQECEIDNELQRLTKIKNELTEKLSKMRNDPQQRRSDQHQQPLSSNPVATASSSVESAIVKHEQSHQQQPAEQQLSFLLSQSKID